MATSWRLGATLGPAELRERIPAEAACDKAEPFNEKLGLGSICGHITLSLGGEMGFGMSYYASLNVYVEGDDFEPPGWLQACAASLTEAGVANSLGALIPSGEHDSYRIWSTATGNTAIVRIRKLIGDAEANILSLIADARDKTGASARFLADTLVLEADTKRTAYIEAWEAVTGSTWPGRRNFSSEHIRSGL